MSFAYVQGSTASRERGTPPTEGVRQDTGQTVSGLKPSDTALLAACGWKPVTATARPADTAQNTSDRSLVVTGGVPVETWTARAKTQAELDSDLANSNRSNIEQQALDAITTNQTFRAIASPTNAQVLAQVRALSLQNIKIIRYVFGHLDDDE